MKNKWARGIAPRNFSWVIKDQLAVSERPGGYARNHRPVRRQEEILWLRQAGFTRIVSLLASPHNLHAYDQFDMPWSHIPFGPHAEPRDVLPELYTRLHDWLGRGEQVLLHQEELGDRLVGVLAGYLLWAGTIASDSVAITVVERIVGRQMGTEGRLVVSAVPEIRLLAPTPAAPGAGG